MRKRCGCLICILLIVVMSFAGCGSSKKTVKIGVSLGVGAAARWDSEKVYLEEKAKELGVDIEVRLNRTDKPKTQTEDCKEMIDSGINVLILTPRDASKATEIIDYAKSKDVPILNYARVVLGQPVDLFVGYDSNKIGQMQGQYLTEMVYKGDYLLLKGDPGDNNAQLVYDGAMRYIEPIKKEINIIGDEAIANWSPDEARKIVKKAIIQNDNKVDAILAPNDVIAGACAEVIEELGIKKHVAITGMDAELDAVKRILKGTQDVTFYLDLKMLAHTAVEEAYHMALGEKVNVNAQYDNKSEDTIDSNLIGGHLVTKQNIDEILIESGHFTKEEVYGSAKKKD